MKKTFVLIAVATLVVAFSVGAYAYYGNPHRGWDRQDAQSGMYGQRGGGMMYGQRDGMVAEQRSNMTSDQRGGMMYGQRRGGMMYGQRRGVMAGQRGGKGGYGPGMRHARGQGGRWNTTQTGIGPCSAPYGTQNTPAQQDAPAQQLQMVSEDKVTEAAESYLKQYLSGYTIDKIEKDSWRPLYFVTITGENEAVQTMVVHGFSGEVVNVFPQAVTK